MLIKQGKTNIKYLLIVVILVAVVGGGVLWCLQKYPSYQSLEVGIPEKKSNEECQKYTEDECPKDCIVCPPCEACSSLECNSAEFCKSIGFDESWYEMVKIQRETADWQTYKNEEYGFEVKYPKFVDLYTTDNEAVIPVLSYMDICDGSNSIVCLYYSGKPNNHSFSASVTINVPQNTNNEIMDEIDCANYNDFDNDYKEMFDIGNIPDKEINDNKFYYLPTGDAGLGHMKDRDLYRIFYHDTCLEIGLNIESINVSDEMALSEEEHKNILLQLEQMLSTFKFID